MPEILHGRLPLAPWMEPHRLRLPGTAPIRPEEWLVRDEVFAEQMAYRDALVAEREAQVHAVLPEGAAAAEETLETVLAHLAEAPGYVREVRGIRRPDGVLVPLDGPPLLTAGRLVQEDFCLMERKADEAEHRLTGAVLCFPSNWTLAQKLGMPLGRIHLPVHRYDADVAKRVQRLFDLVRPEAPLMRANLLVYGASDLFNPRVEFARHEPPSGTGRFVRVERQVLLRLPRSRAVVFSIHTFMVGLDALSAEQRDALSSARPGAFLDMLRSGTRR
jgi:hypothetical protein